jgi:hypothetical protein
MIYDFVGTEITPGCTCVYPLRRGSKMWLTTIKVDGIQKIKDGDQIVDTLTGFNSNGRWTKTKNIKNCIVI